MTEKALIVQRLAGPEDNSGTERLNPSWEEIEQAIRQLDGDRRTLFTLGLSDPPVPHMSIGGGGCGLYIIYATEDNLTFNTLVNPDSPPGKCTLIAGGQPGRYDRKLCVELKSALRAARTYAETGKCDSELVWQR